MDTADAQEILGRLDRLELQNQRLRFGLIGVAALCLVSLSLWGLQPRVADAQTSRVITAEWLLIEKGGRRYASLGVNNDNNVVFELRKQTEAGCMCILGYVSDNLSTLAVFGLPGGAASAELRAEKDGAGGATIRGPGQETIWSAP